MLLTKQSKKVRFTMKLRHLSVMKKTPIKRRHRCNMHLWLVALKPPQQWQARKATQTCHPSKLPVGRAVRKWGPTLRPSQRQPRWLYSLEVRMGTPLMRSLVASANHTNERLNFLKKMIQRTRELSLWGEPVEILEKTPREVRWP